MTTKFSTLSIVPTYYSITNNRVLFISIILLRDVLLSQRDSAAPLCQEKSLLTAAQPVFFSRSVSLQS